jgi:predicted outer membrane repeat protein
LGILTIHNSTFTDNRGYTHAGAVNTHSQNLATITDSTFTNKRATTTGSNNQGGAVSASGPITITGSTFSNNMARSGAAIYLYNGGQTTVTLDDNVFNNNAATFGGVIYSLGANVTMTNSLLHNNSGGALYIVRHDWLNILGSFDISGSCLSGNTSFAAYNGSSVPFNAANNWWGASDGPSLNTIGGGGGDLIYNMPITYTPFVTTPPAGCNTLLPIANAQNVNVLFNTATNITLSGRGGIAPYTFSNISDPPHGTISGTAPNIIYTPDTNYTGTDSFTFQITDSVSGTAVGTINTTIVSDLATQNQTIYRPFGTTSVPVTLTATGGTQPYTFSNISIAPNSNGTLTGTAPNLTYTPPAGGSGFIAFNYTVTDAFNFTRNGSVTISIATDLIVPNQNLYGSPGVARSIPLGIMGGRTPFTYNISTPANGTLTGTPPTLSYTMNAGFSGVDSFTVEVTDANGTVKTGTVRISSAAQLTGADFALITPYEMPQLFSLSATGGFSPYTYTITDAPNHGTLTGTAPNLMYTPNAGYSGPDTFTYRVADSYNYTDTAVVNITVRDQLTVANQQLDVIYDTPYRFRIIYTGGEAPYAFSYSTPSNGTISGTTPAELTYTPNAGFSGTDTFTVTTTDQLGRSKTGTITVIVNAPVNVSDVSGLIAAINAANATPGGDTIILAPNIYDLTTSNNSTGERGGNGLPVITANLAIVGAGTITRPANTNYYRFLEVAPEVQLILDGMTLDGGRVSANSGGAIYNRGNLTVRNVVFINNIAQNGGAIYNTTSVGRATITNSHFENNNGSNFGGAIFNNAASVTINSSVLIDNRTTGGGGAIYNTGTLVVNDSTLINNTAHSTGHGGSALLVGTSSGLVTLTNNCFAANSLSTIRTLPASGTVNAQQNWWGNPNGPVTGAINGTVNTTNFLTSGILGCPTPSNFTLHTPYQQSVPFTMSGTTGGTPPYTYSLFTDPPHGTVTGTSPDFTYTPDNGYSGAETIFMRVVDSAGLPGISVISVTIAPQLVVTNQDLSTSPNTALPITLTVSGGTPPYTYNPIPAPANGVVSGTAPNITYTPNNGFTGTDSFTYSVTDGDGVTATATITIAVFPLTAPDQTVNTNYNTAVNITLTSSGGRAPRTYTAVGTPTNGEVVGLPPNVTYIPDFGFTGTDSFTFSVSDANGASATGTITVNVGTEPPANIVVNSTANETGNCTFGEALTAAHSNTAVDGCAAGSTGTDIIQLPAGTFGVTGSQGSHAIGISTNLVIRGAGRELTIIEPSASNYFGLMRITTQGNVTLQGLTLRNGGYDGGTFNRGGAIYNEGTLTVYDVRFENNRATNDGGAIYNLGPSLTIINSVFVGNRSTFRGAAIISFTNTNTIIRNSAFQDNDSIQGNSLITYGQASVSGSCILDDHISGSGSRDIIGNASPNVDARYNWWGDGDGGAYVSGTDITPFSPTRTPSCAWLTIPSLTIPPGDSEALLAAFEYARGLQNATIELAAGSTYDMTETFDVTIGTDYGVFPWLGTGLTINGNGATITKDPALEARFFTVDNNGHLRLNNLTLSNGLEEDGGAVYVTHGAFTANGVNFLNNNSLVTGFATGGAIYSHLGTVTVNNSIFDNNTAPSGAAIYTSFANGLTVTNSVFINNQGYAIRLHRNSGAPLPTISNSCFINNNGVSVSGPGSAINNWWGAVDGPSGAGGGSGDAVSVETTFAPFLTTLPAHCPNTEPTAHDQTLQMFSLDTQLAITLTASYGTLPYTSFTTGTPAHGSVSGTGANVIYMPESGFAGTDSFTFTVTDTDGETDTGTITINVLSNYINVNSTAQEQPFVTNGNCTLGEAIVAANTDTTVDGCLSGANINAIQLMAGTYTLTAANNATNGANGLPSVTSEITIFGSGAVITRSSVESTPEFRIFHTALDSSLTLHDLTISNGYIGSANLNDAYGGGIYAQGELTLDGVTVTGNSVTQGGGGIVVDSTDQPLTITNSTISDNSASSGGGVSTSTMMTVTNSTFASNTATSGGGAILARTLLTISDSTFTGNFSNQYGGAIYLITYANANITNSVFSGNLGVASTIYNDSNLFNTVSLTIHESCLLDHTSQDIVKRNNSVQMNLTNNWWGSTTGPGGVGGGFGSTIVGTGLTSTVYAPFYNAPINGCDIFNVTAYDQTLNTAYQTAVNIAPFTAADGAPPYTFSELSTPVNGVISGTAPNYTYTPNAGFSGTETLTFTATDSENVSDTGTITINVKPQLVLNNQTLNTTYFTAINFTLTATGGASPYTFSVVTEPANGLLSGTGASRTYQPNLGFSGVETITFRVTDALGTTADGTVSITVGAALTATNQTLTGQFNTGLTLMLGATGGRPPYTFGTFSTPANGAVIGTGQLITYAPRTDFMGTDSFTFVVTDANSHTSTGTITINVNEAPPVNLVLTQTDSPDPVIVGQNLTYTITVNNDSANTARNVVLTDNLPNSVTYVSANASQGTGCAHNTGVVTCNLVSLNASSQATVTIVVTTTAQNVSLTNNITVSASESDTHPADNSSSTTTQVTANTFTLLSPTGTITAGYGNPTYQWVDVPDAQYYYLVVSNSSGAQVMNEVLSDAGYCNGSTCSIDATTLRESYRLANGTYSLYLNTWNGSTQGTWQGPFAFTLNAATPNIPTLNAPTNITTRRPTFNWTLSGTATNATFFNLVVAPTNNPGAPSINQWFTRAESCGTVNGTTCAIVSPIDLPDGTSYAIYLRSYGPGGISVGGTGGFAGPQNFTVDAIAPALPSGITVNNNQGRATFTWNDDANAAYFNLYVTTNAGVSQHNAWYARNDVCTGGTCSVTPVIALVNGSYQARVKAWGAGGFSTGGTANDGYGGPVAFTFNFAVPNIGEITTFSPNGSIVTGSPTFTWNTVAGTTYYLLWVTGNAPAYSPSYHQVWYDATAICTPHPGTCTVSNVVTLPMGNAVWRVQAYGPGGVSALHSDIAIAVNSTLPSALTLNNPTGTITTNAPAFTWVDDPTVDWYNLYVYSSSASIVNQWYRAERGIGKLCDAGTCSLVIPNVTLANGGYGWNVRGFAPAGLGAWNATPMSFNVAIAAPSAPTQVTPVDSAIINTTNRPTFVWNTTPFATFYHLEIRNGMGTLVFDQWYPANTGGCNASTCTVQIPNPIAYGGYNWRVQAYSQGGLGAFSAPRSFFSLSTNTQPMMVQADASSVQRGGTWNTTMNELAGGQSFLTSSGSAADTLTFSFTGTEAQVVYIMGASYGSFVIEVDTVPMLAINAHAAQTSVGNLAAVSGLSEGQHTLRIIPLGGAPVAIDALIVNGQVLTVNTTPTPIVTPTMIIPTLVVTEEVTPTTETTVEPTNVVPTVAPTAEPTLEPTVVPTDVPTIAPTIEPTIEPTAADVPTEAPTEVVTPTP